MIFVRLRGTHKSYQGGFYFSRFISRITGMLELQKTWLAFPSIASIFSLARQVHFFFSTIKHKHHTL